MAAPIRVLVVDDSATARAVLTRTLATDPGIEVVGRAVDGIQALIRIAELKPDVVTLDIEMPRLDGLQTLERIMQEMPTPVVMVSTLTRKGAEASLRALELGAVDFIEKPNQGGVVLTQVIESLCEKVRAAATARVRRVRPTSGAPTSLHASATPALVRAVTAAPARPRPVVSHSGWQRRLVVIGSSTGGPQALKAVLCGLPPDLGVPVVVVQHMPAGFTTLLAERLNGLGPLPVSEAHAGSTLENGHVLLAPGGLHMVFDARGVVSLSNAPAECGVRPAVNVTMESIAALKAWNPLAVVLTGMGVDGARGAGLIRAAGGEVIAEDESTAVIYGMPRAVIEAGLADEVRPLDEIAEAIVRRCRASAAASA